MASPSTTPNGAPGAGIAFAEPEVDDQAHASSDTEGAHKSETKSCDDDTLTAPDAEKKDIKDEQPSVFERIRSGPKVAKKKIKLQDAEFGGPSHNMHPTNAKLNIRRGSDSGTRRTSETTDGEQPPRTGDPLKDFEVMWRSRDNRKGSVAVPVSPRGGSITMRLAFAAGDMGKGIKKMFTFFPYWDMSWWSGWTYTVGCVLFVIEGFWAWLPVGWPDTEFTGEAKYGVPLGFFFGALFFQVGGTMAYLEAINDGSFSGSAMKRLLIGHDKEAKELLDEKMAAFFGHINPAHHDKSEDQDKEREKRESQIDPEAGWRSMQKRERQQSTYADLPRRAPRRGGLDLGEAEEGETVEYTQWRWWPTWHRLRTHHIYEVGYVSCAIQLFGVTLYGVTSIVILPGILSSLSEWQENAAYWIPQLVAASCFLIASFGFTWETQVKWYKPEFGVLGWWIGFWSIVGSVGFLLCAAFGITAYNSSGNEYQSELSTTWGSFAYLFGSMLQWYEAVNKHSVSNLFDNEGGTEVNAPVQPLSRGISERTEVDRKGGRPLSKEQTPISPMAQKETAQSFQQRQAVSEAGEDREQIDLQASFREPEKVEEELEPQKSH